MKRLNHRKATGCIGATLICALFLVSACSEIIRNHGYTPSDEQLEEILVGVDTRGTVEEVVGRPSAAGVLEGGDWFYVSSAVRHYGIRKPEEINRQVVAISFDDGDVVQNVERFALEDGQVVTLSRRVTETTIRDATFIRQIIRNFGRISLDDALGE
ncbi:MAG: outer membrane protein assembly factor BamE [Litoreibacter sp.]|nr:outer membrane protein assembly factor BamE [Litoreibacter sp.]